MKDQIVKNKTLDTFLAFLAVGVLVFLTILGGMYLGKRPTIIAKEKQYKTYCTVYQLGKRSWAKYYFSDGSAHNADIAKVYTEVLGDKYNILVDKDDVETDIVLYSEPVFLPGEITDSSIGTIKDTDNFTPYSNFIAETLAGWSPSITFTYTVNGKEYEREQELPADFKTRYQPLKPSQKYPIRYWLKNYQRAIMYIPEK